MKHWYTLRVKIKTLWILSVKLMTNSKCYYCDCVTQSEWLIVQFWQKSNCALKKLLKALKVKVVFVYLLTESELKLMSPEIFSLHSGWGLTKDPVWRWWITLTWNVCLQPPHSWTRSYTSIMDSFLCKTRLCICASCSHVTFFSEITTLSLDNL